MGVFVTCTFLSLCLGLGSSQAQTGKARSGTTGPTTLVQLAALHPQVLALDWACLHLANEYLVDGLY